MIESIEGIKKLIRNKNQMIRHCRMWLRHGGEQFRGYRECLDTAVKCMRDVAKLKIIKSELEKLV